MTLLSTTPTPNGNHVELHEEGGIFTTRLFVMENCSEVDAEQAFGWYRQASFCGGTQHERFPMEEVGR